MRIFILFLLVFLSFHATAQWSDTNNKFYDSLVMKVTTIAGNQNNVVIQQTFPDSGFILIWNDTRSGKTQIYAQKYDKEGYRLWTDNGILVGNSPNVQYLSDYIGNTSRIYSKTATDSSGGCYVIYTDDANLSGSSGYSAVVQHINPDGSVVFPNEGYILASKLTILHDLFQLIADGKKGFFAGYVGGNNNENLYTFCMKDENGTMKSYGGGLMNVNTYEKPILQFPCNQIFKEIGTRDASVVDFHLYPDLQGGCNVSMVLYEIADNLYERNYIGYNKLVRVKKDSYVHRDAPYNDVLFYKKDSTVVMYQYFFDKILQQCDAIIRENYIQRSNGFLQVTENLATANYVRGAALSTDGNVNIIINGLVCSRYTNDSYGLQHLRYFSLADEKYDSIPYPFTNAPYYRPMTLVNTRKPGLDKVNYGRDTLMISNATNRYFDFSLAGLKDRIYFAAKVPASPQSVIETNVIKLQRVASDSFSTSSVRADRSPLVLGQEVYGYPGSGTDIYYNIPHIAAGSDGTVVFYIGETDRYLRVSPLNENGNVTWNPMGTPVEPSKGLTPWLVVDPVNGKGVVASEYFVNDTYQRDIVMRHLDGLSTSNFTPPAIKVKKLLPASNISFINNLYGTSGLWALFTDPTTNSSLAAVKDDFKLGAFQVFVYENQNAIRQLNNHFYLDRNFTIQPPNDPSGTPIKVRLYFSEEDLNNLKNADPSITNPGMLAVIKQPHTGIPNTVPDKINESAAITQITPDAWGTVADGGYFVEFTVTGFSDFFIRKNYSALPVTWVNIQAVWLNNDNVQITWVVTNQIDIKNYIAQQSEDGIHYKDACTELPNTTGRYSCIVPVAEKGIHYFRIKETDLDDKISFSKTVKLSTDVLNKTGIYPNPVHTEINVSSTITYGQYSITDIAGKVLKKGISTGNNKIDVSSLVRGVYILKLSGNGEIYSLKFVKE
ncbi:MAG: hypothetical protein B6D37_14580 [Sphingobacteriales bacterium UTBCD1]|jgi:hypothetical protein|nr:MAG: hypothetical protein B6D37_14580 [Sphingobacteriales bacterium UTBCD1]